MNHLHLAKVTEEEFLNLVLAYPSRPWTTEHFLSTFLLSTLATRPELFLLGSYCPDSFMCQDQLQQSLK